MEEDLQISTFDSTVYVESNCSVKDGYIKLTCVKQDYISNGYVKIYVKKSMTNVSHNYCTQNIYMNIK